MGSPFDLTCVLRVETPLDTAEAYPHKRCESTICEGRLVLDLDGMAMDALHDGDDPSTYMTVQLAVRVDGVNVDRDREVGHDRWDLTIPKFRTSHVCVPLVWQFAPYYPASLSEGTKRNMNKRVHKKTPFVKAIYLHTKK